MGYAHGSGLALKLNRAEPEPRAQPVTDSKLNGGAEPRLTSGGEAETNVAKNLDHEDYYERWVATEGHPYKQFAKRT